jgi:hypothetical protein
MAKNPWIFQQRAAIQKAYNRALEFYSPRTALAKVRQLVQAPARDFQILPGWNGTRAGLKGDRSRHPLIISIRQLRIKRTGLTPEQQAAGIARPLETYKSETTRIAASRQRKTKATTGLKKRSLLDRLRGDASALDAVEDYRGRKYRASESGCENYLENRQRWLDGETLDWADYFN